MPLSSEKACSMFTVNLNRVRNLSDSTRDFQFLRTDGLQTDYKPGQFFRFTFTDGEGEFERSYSLCNFAELYGKNLELVVSKVVGGRATQLLFGDDEEITATVTGPFGRLVLPATRPERLIMVATSVGIAPFLPILKELESANYANVLLLFGVRDRSEFLYSELLLDYAQRHPWFELRVCLSRESASQTYERNGYVNDQIDSFDPSVETDHVLLCGNPAMVEEGWQRLKACGLKAKQVVREKYVFAKDKKVSATALTDAQRKLIEEKMNKYS